MRFIFQHNPFCRSHISSIGVAVAQSPLMVSIVTIDGQKVTGQQVTIDGQHVTIESQQVTIDGHKVTIDGQHSHIDSQQVTINGQHSQH